MTKENLITAPVGTSLAEAKEILRKHRIEKLPLVDKEGNLQGSSTIKDIEKATKYPNSAKDGNGRLLVAAAVGVTHDMTDRLDALVAAKVDVVVIDTAHGHSLGVLNTLKEIKKMYPHLPVIAGNVATGAATEALIECGVDAVKVGIGLAPSARPVSSLVSAYRRSRPSMNVLKSLSAMVSPSSPTAASSIPVIWPKPSLPAATSS